MPNLICFCISLIKADFDFFKFEKEDFKNNLLMHVLQIKLMSCLLNVELNTG